MKPIIARPHPQMTQPKASFGQARAEHMQQRLSSALKERRTLAAAQQGAQQSQNLPMQDVLAVKERMAEHKIDRLQADLAGSSEPADI